MGGSGLTRRRGQPIRVIGGGFGGTTTVFERTTI